MTTVTTLRRVAGLMPLAEASRRFLRRAAFAHAVSDGWNLAQVRARSRALVAPLVGGVCEPVGRLHPRDDRRPRQRRPAAAQAARGSGCAVTGEMRRVPVDWAFYGDRGAGMTLSIRLFPEERDGLAVGDHVLLIGDDVTPREAEVTAVSEGRDFELRLTDG